MPAQNPFPRRTPRRQMVPRFQPEPESGRYAPPPPRRQEPPAAPVPEPQEPEIPPFAGFPQRDRRDSAGEKQPAAQKPLLPPELAGLLTDLPDRLRRMDGETLLLLALLWMLWQDKADRKLLLALCYILL